MVEKFKTSLKIKAKSLDISLSKTSTGLDIYVLHFFDEKFGRIKIKFVEKTQIEALKDLQKKIDDLEEVTLGFYGTPYIDDHNVRPSQIFSLGILIKDEDDIFKVVEMVNKKSKNYHEDQKSIPFQLARFA